MANSQLTAYMVGQMVGESIAANRAHNDARLDAAYAEMHARGISPLLVWLCCWAVVVIVTVSVFSNAAAQRRALHPVAQYVPAHRVVQYSTPAPYVLPADIREKMRRQSGVH